MHFMIELLVDLLVEIVFDGLIELIKKLFELVVRLVRTIGRFAGWIIGQRWRHRETIYFASGKSAREAVGSEGIFSPSRRRRARRGRAAHEIG